MKMSNKDIEKIISDKLSELRKCPCGTYFKYKPDPINGKLTFKFCKSCDRDNKINKIINE